MEDFSKRYVCCFTGHRPEKLNIAEREIRLRLEAAIDEALNDGYTVFISGMSRGVDLWAAEIVLNKRSVDEKIKLICDSPYRGFEKPWSIPEQYRYNKIIQNADRVIYLSEHYYKGCFQIRNCHMVNNSSRVIAAYTGENGGTKNTVEYAKKRQIEIVNILLPEEIC